VGPIASLDDLEKRKFLTLTELELRPLGRPDCSQSLYRLRLIIILLYYMLVQIPRSFIIRHLVRLSQFVSIEIEVQEVHRPC
jgi:hypothetical protein